MHKRRARLIERHFSLCIWQENGVLSKALNLLLEQIEAERALVLDFCVPLFQVHDARCDTSDILRHILDQGFTRATMHSSNGNERFHY